MLQLLIQSAMDSYNYRQLLNDLQVLCEHLIDKLYCISQTASLPKNTNEER